MARGTTLRRNLPVIALTALVTALVTIVVLNLTLGDKQVDRRFGTTYSVRDPQFVRSMSALLGPSILPGNRATALYNGDQIFPAMLDAIRSARRSITFETYIYWEGEIGRAFAEALAERARAGVRVHLMLDAVGSGRIDTSYVEAMKRAGVEVRLYHPVRWYTLARLNNRTHRKLLIVDGGVGFTGGVGIADQWTGNAQDADHWRDTHFRIEGPVVAAMQSAFMDNWIETTGEVLHGPEYFPPLAPVGGQGAQVFSSSPGGGAESVQLMYLLSIAAARESIDLSMAYFIPDELATLAFVAARERGVRVRIILPGANSDVALVEHASQAAWGPLLRAGVEIYTYLPTMYHCKVMVVDGVWTSVGSTNFDSRSFATNDETNLNVHDPQFGAAQVRAFEDDLKRSRRITLEEWENRPWTEKARDYLAGLLSSQL